MSSTNKQQFIHSISTHLIIHLHNHSMFAVLAEGFSTVGDEISGCLCDAGVYALILSHCSSFYIYCDRRDIDTH
ncbi:hypothetical protein AKJ16_DCAP10141 [Drosera capensis]